MIEQAERPPMDERSKYLRRLVVRAMNAAKRGHLGSSMSLIEIIRVLYDHILHIDPRVPDDPQRDRFILSKGHGCLALYAVLADHGFFPLDLLNTFCAFDSPLGGHPEAHSVPGVEASTGALGHGLSIGLGMALAARMQKRRSRVFRGDGRWRKSTKDQCGKRPLCAGKHHLSNLVAIVDYNKIQSYGPTRDVQDLEPLMDKWRSFNFGVQEVDGHDLVALRRVFDHIPAIDGKPTAVICHTIKGKGIPMAENNPAWHHKSKLKDDELAAIREALGGE